MANQPTKTGQGEAKVRPFYKSLEHTLEDVGITARQLNYWRKHGLFKPEMDDNPRYFTETDIDQLKFLRRLIVEIRLPVETVGHMLEEVRGRKHAMSPYFTYLNIASGKLVLPKDAFAEMFAFYAGHAPTDKLEDWLLTLALVRFRQIQQSDGTPRAYQAKRDELLDRIKRMDLLARAEDEVWDPDIEELGDPILRPLLSDDDEFSTEALNGFAGQRRRRLQPVEEARRRGFST